MAKYGKNEKPMSMTHRDWFVRQLSQTLPFEYSVIDKVIKHQFESVVAATHKNKSIEISGFGVIHWYEKRAMKLLELYNRQIETYRFKILESDDNDNEEVAKWTETIDEILIKKRNLIKRLYEFNPDLRGMEE
jgi:vacuolar-type H+-ATPase subunit I/STV1